MSNNLDLDQAQRFVRPDLVPNVLQRLFADNNHFMKMQDLAFKKGVLIFWFTQFLLPWLAF